MNIKIIKSILYKIVRTYNLLLAIIPSIAFYRATVQPEYKWGLLVIHGKGMSSEYWYLLFFMFFAWLIFILEIWYRRRWYYILPLLLFTIVTTVLVFSYLSQNEMVFQGDVWKFKFEIGSLFVALSVFLLVLSIVWALMDLKAFKASNLSLSKNNKVKLLCGLSLSIIIFLLFAQGQGGVHTIIDGIAVALTVIQALFMANVIDKTGYAQQE